MLTIDGAKIAAAARNSVEGIWSYEIYGPYGWEACGVHVLENGRVIGGDDRQYSTGRYSVFGNTIKAEIVIHNYAPPPAVFGEKRVQYEVELTGELGRGVINGQIARPDRPRFGLQCRLTRRADLPAA